MSRLICSLVAGSALLLGRTSHATDQSLPSPRSQVVRAAMRESVRIQMSSHGEVRRSATGVVVESTPAGDGAPARSIVMTNAHVADPEGLKDPTYAILIEQHGRVVQTLPAKVIAMGQVPDLDLALLEVDAALPSAELAREDAIDVGDDVVVIGAPYGRSLSVSGGLVSQLEPEDGAGTEPRYSGMKTDAAIGYGCSGGGVFEVPSGQLVGIVEGYRTARVNIDDNRAFDVPMPGETFVAPVTKVRRFLTEHFAAVHPGKVAPTATATALAAGPMPAPTTPTAPIGEPRTAAH